MRERASGSCGMLGIFVSASSLRVFEVQVAVQDLQLRQPGKYQWRGAQTDVADEVARIRRRDRCRRWLGRPNGHYDARHEADKHWDVVISITLPRLSKNITFDADGRLTLGNNQRPAGAQRIRKQRPNPYWLPSSVFHHRVICSQTSYQIAH
jgi:hypothetical protein